MNEAPFSHSPPITVTRSTLPPLEEYIGYLRGIWDRRWLTNNGPLVRELEEKLRSHLGVSQLWFINNCTTALQLSIKALGLRGEIITTPFSYVATTGVPLWENCQPVFVDVRPGDLTVDPALIERAITPRTSGILATHVYGLPCDVDALAEIARRHQLRLIFDAAHAFGCQLRGRSLASYGDVSCLSFHATKVFHTVEGGAVVINGDSECAERIRLMRAFGHHGDDHRCLGINGKNSEFHAAMGLCNLPRTEVVIESRRAQHEYYLQLLAGRNLRTPSSALDGFQANFAYFPILLPNEASVLRGLAALAEKNIFGRRYFYPSLNRLPYLEQQYSCPVAEHAAETVVCLPMGDGVTPTVQEEIAQILIRAARI